MNTPQFTGHVNFKIHGQKALPKFQQELNRRFIEEGGSMPESLRFQCRIAQDARENFERIELADGTTLSLHHRAKPQFGKNRDGLPYLTVTLVWSGDGKGYRFRWIGKEVPLKMQRVAVSHDQGKEVPAAMVRLNLAAAEVVPAHVVNGHTNAPSRSTDAQRQYRERVKAEGRKPKEKRGPRHCARLTEADIAA